MPNGVFVSSDGSHLHGPNGERLPGILVQYEDDDEWIKSEDPNAWNGRAVVPADEYRDQDGGDDGPNATSAAVELADEHGIDLESVEGTGGRDGDLVTKGDVQDVLDEIEEDEDDGSSGGGEESSDDEGEEPNAIDFASDEAAELFTDPDTDVDPVDLSNLEPSGDGGYTVDDVERAIKGGDEEGEG